MERVIKLTERARLRETKEKNEKYKRAIDELQRLENSQRDLEYRFRVRKYNFKQSYVMFYVDDLVRDRVKL